ncbi:MAG: hypothetical protein L6R39_007307 [Caloplaca ligustica]|nr:MAG: hypothetical protein L6R39_007307 [Caloplaca ligustica]
MQDPDGILIGGSVFALKEENRKAKSIDVVLGSHTDSPSVPSEVSDGVSDHVTDPQRNRFLFQHTWFDDEIKPHWEAHTPHLRNKQLFILEIGCFEGASTTWLLDNLMSNRGSTMTTIDTFAGGMEHQDTDQVHKYDLNTLEQRFRSNVSRCSNSDRLTVMKMTSDEALLKLRREQASFNFIYIDASHVAIDVLHDAVLCWRMLSVGGKMVFDDFTWKGYMEECYNPRIAIRSFLGCTASEVEAKEIGYQMWVTKVPRRFDATPNPDPDLVYKD